MHLLMHTGSDGQPVTAKQLEAASGMCQMTKPRSKGILEELLKARTFMEDFEAGGYGTCFAVEANKY